ncbi:MAG TPA: DUF3105 domain-containing protein [Jatrophihabitans sp.]|uniref:DUF3105 domain-containing protein n=1 Tax=Jatrophihabitans sp. TaxID=1932789 RepID=UPI002DFED4F6|nr:DUF3105 domain-containing protein [Jatrophihabitans sp.]
MHVDDVRFGYGCAAVVHHVRFGGPGRAAGRGCHPGRHVPPGARSHPRHRRRPLRHDPTRGWTAQRLLGRLHRHVYPQPIANENAVHMLEHGAVWVTYREGLDPAKVATLTSLISGLDHTALSPYPDLRSAVSLQAWGYQLFVDDPTDPRIAQFIQLLRGNPDTTPEPGATCSNPSFKSHPSTFGHPLDGP